VTFVFVNVFLMVFVDYALLLVPCLHETDSCSPFGSSHVLVAQRRRVSELLACVIQVSKRDMDNRGDGAANVSNVGCHRRLVVAWHLRA